MPRKLFIRILLYSLPVVFIAVNVLAFSHAYKFTHFDRIPELKIAPNNLTLAEKIKYTCTGIDNARPMCKRKPGVPYETIRIKSNTELEGWLIRADKPRGTVLMFHGYKAEKSELLDRAYIFRDAGYNTLLVDFMGSGGSGGDEVTIGYHEAQNVTDCYNYIAKQGEENIILFGISMGAAAIMKSAADGKVQPNAIIIEAPFGSMQQTVNNRFAQMGLPSFPMAHLLVLWGGLQHGFWAFSHNPADYAKKVNCPLMLIYGAQDDRVTLEEIEAIQNNLKGESKLAIYPNAGHVNFLEEYRNQWTNDVLAFAGKWMRST